MIVQVANTTKAKMVAEEVICVTSPGRRLVNKRKKRRAADAIIKTFDDLYAATGELLGTGSFGNVSTYLQISNNMEFAVKVVNTDKKHSRFKVLKEIEIFHYCKDHKSIVQLHQYFEEGNRFYLIFEKMKGGTLADALIRFGRPTENTTREIIIDVAAGLDFLHDKGVAHRDLKPENILCVRTDQLNPVKICDFDLASEIRMENNRTRRNSEELYSPVGSPAYMSPELIDVWKNKGWTYDKSCDLWSLGILLYMILFGCQPFDVGPCDHCQKQENMHGLSCNNCLDRLFECIQRGDYEFPKTEEEDFEISDGAKNLIDRLLVVTPKWRYSAKEVLMDPWILNTIISCRENRKTLSSSSSDERGASDENDSELSRYEMIPLSPPPPPLPPIQVPCGITADVEAMTNGPFEFCTSLPSGDDFRSSFSDDGSGPWCDYTLSEEENCNYYPPPPPPTTLQQSSIDSGIVAREC